MKKRLLSLILVLFLSLLPLAACSKETQGPTGETTSPARSDHEIQSEFLSAVPSGEHEVRILTANVGKADAILLEIDGGRFLLDTGTTASVPALLTAMAYLGWNSLDGLFVTHADNDHVGGADELCALFPVKQYYTAAISQNMEKLTAPALLREVPCTALEPGTCVPLADGVFFEVFGPYRYNPLDDNDNSLVMKLRVNGVSMLFTGDMCFDEEKTLLSKESFSLASDILKVGHHGRKDATAAQFLEAVSPKIALISTDSEEEPSSPHKSILKALDDLGASVYVTEDYDVGILLIVGQDGSIQVEDAHIQTAPEADLVLDGVYKETQTALIRNNGTETVSLDGYFLFSTQGSELFVFPKGSSLAPGEAVTVACGEEGNAFSFAEDRVWSRNKEDEAILYDRYGNVLDRQKSVS